ncbi:MAG: glycerate kinase [Gudongella sp.]|jgi:glycerate kinase|nr:glycerate kinase [Gudongella sp.]
MNLLIASDSFKGSLSSIEVSNALERGLLSVMPNANITKLPIADGGEGTVDALITATGGTIINTEVTGPSGNTIDSYFGILPDGSAIIEMAAASGITLVKDGILDPLNTTTYGTGELIKKALEMGCKKLYIGIGGSATNDGGIGMAQALGISFKDKNGEELPFGGGNLNKLQTIDILNSNKLLNEAEIIVISDVTNPLCGPNGASFVYGPQKGATPEMVEQLDNNLMHLADKIKEQLEKDVLDMPGSGAAGGLGAGLVAFCNARLERGIDIMLEILKFDEKLENADVVITGEGRIDSQSAHGKAISGIAKRAKSKNVPVIAIGGGLEEGYEELYNTGVDLILPIVDKPMPLEEAIKNAASLVESTGTHLARILSLSY